MPVPNPPSTIEVTLERRSAWNTFVFALPPSTVGLAILVVYYYTGADACVFTGLLWLAVGGVWTLATAVVAIAGLVRAFRRPAEFSRAISWYAWTLAMCLLAVIAAVVCVAIGGDLATATYIRLTVTNNTAVPIDRVVVHFQSGDVGVDSLSAGQRRDVSPVWPRHGGPLDITVTANGQSRRKTDQTHVEERNFRAHHFDVVVESVELPRTPTTGK